MIPGCLTDFLRDGLLGEEIEIQGVAYVKCPVEIDGDLSDEWNLGGSTLRIRRRKPLYLNSTCED
jgi:hypothetical protein